MTLALVSVLLYVSIGLAAAVIVARARRQTHAMEVTTSPTVSVIVAARDEELALPECLATLSRQVYDSNIEFLIVDDDSSDNTRQIVEQWAAFDPRFHCVSPDHIRGMEPGKARAIHAGIEASSNDLIVLTDADCRPPSTWLKGIAGAFNQPAVGVVGGITRVRAARPLEKIQALDWALLLAVASGWSLLGRPLTAMGNNMAFRRDAYDDVGGYRGIRASVTEDYALFQAIGQHPDWTAQLLADPTIENDTEPVESIVDMFRQRRRWARGALSASPLAFVFYAIILAAHALPLFIAPLYPAEAGAMIATKILTDAAVLAVAGQPWPGARPTDRWGWFIPFQAWLYAYVLALPLSLAVVPDIRWKGRDFVSQASRASEASGS